MLPFFRLRSPVRHGFPCSQGPGIPNPQCSKRFLPGYLPSNAVCYFIPSGRPVKPSSHSQGLYIMNALPSPQSVKPRLITEIYLVRCSYDLHFKSIHYLPFHSASQHISGCVSLFPYGIATVLTNENAVFLISHPAANAAFPADILPHNFNKFY